MDTKFGRRNAGKALMIIIGVISSAILTTFSLTNNPPNLGPWKDIGYLIAAFLILSGILTHFMDLQSKTDKLQSAIDNFTKGLPNLIYHGDWVEHKEITPNTPLILNHIYDLQSGLPPYNGKTSPSSDIESIESAMSFELFDNNVAGIWIANDPESRNRLSTAEDVIAYITFFTSNGEREIKGRWWKKESALYPKKEDVDLDGLRKITISPPDPERLVIAYKIKNGNLFYPFDYKTHLEIVEQRQKGNLGKGNIRFQVVFEGLNLRKTPPQKFILDGSYDKITIRKDIS